MRRLASLLLLLSGLPAAAQTAPSAPPSPSNAILVELFTSEGCSDCPLADDLLRAISGTHTAQGRTIIVLSEHVTYWDQLGWKDAFSDPTFTARQNGYGYRFHLDSVYTPQMVVNGSQQFVGNNRNALLDALHKEVARQEVALQITSVDPGPEALTVHFSAANVSSATPLDVMAAVTDDLDQTHVLHGENGGRTLTHASVARSLTRVAEIRGNAEQTVHIAWPASFKQSPQSAHHVVLFVQQHNQGRILAVTTKPLPTAVAVAANH